MSYMKKYILFGIFGMMLFLGACNKDEENITAEKENNWFAIPDRPGELGELLYDIYINSGISIFVNDTLGSTYRGKDAYGNPAYDYETITEKFYIYGNREQIRFVLPQDTSAMILAAKTIKKWVIPNLPSKLSEQRIKSILLTDSLLWSIYGGDTLKFKDGKTAWVSNISVETLPVGRLCDIKNMDEKTLKFWAGMILSERPSAWMMKNYPDEMYQMQVITHEDSKRGLKYKFYSTGESYCIWSVDGNTGEFTMEEKYITDTWDCYKKGFLEYVDTPQTKGPFIDPWGDCIIEYTYKFPIPVIDLMNYIASIYAYSDAEFESMFEGIDGRVKILKKRNLVKQLLEKFESKFEVTRHPFTSFE